MAKVFIATEPCGCVTAAHVDDNSAILSEWVLDWIRDGRAVTAVDMPISIPKRCNQHSTTTETSDMELEEAMAVVSSLDSAIKAGIRKTYDPLALQLAACKLLEALAAALAERDAAQSKLATAVQALRDIADPIAKMRRELPETHSLDGMMAVRLSDDPHHLKAEAMRTLKKLLTPDTEATE